MAPSHMKEPRFLRTLSTGAVSSHTIKPFCSNKRGSRCDELANSGQLGVQFFTAGGSGKYHDYFPLLRIVNEAGMVCTKPGLGLKYLKSAVDGSGKDQFL